MHPIQCISNAIEFKFKCLYLIWWAISTSSIQIHSIQYRLFGPYGWGLRSCVREMHHWRLSGLAVLNQERPPMQCIFVHCKSITNTIPIKRNVIQINRVHARNASSRIFQSDSMQNFWREKASIRKQARKPRSYASSKLCPLTHSLTGVRCRATSIAKKGVSAISPKQIKHFWDFLRVQIVNNLLELSLVKIHIHN